MNRTEKKEPVDICSDIQQQQKQIRKAGRKELVFCFTMKGKKNKKSNLNCRYSKRQQHQEKPKNFFALFLGFAP